MNSILLSAMEEPTEYIEEVLQYNTDDLYRVLSECSNELNNISNQLGELQELGSELLQLLQSSFIDSLAAFLLILVCFETMKLVRGWTKGVLFNGRNR